MPNTETTNAKPIRNAFSAIERIARGEPLSTFIERIEIQSGFWWETAVSGAVVFYRSRPDACPTVLAELQKLEVLAETIGEDV